MRSIFSSLAMLMLVMLLLRCTYVDPSECWPNTSGGLGGGGTIPIGAAVGASASGDFLSPPPGGPLDYGGTSNPCMASTKPPPSTGSTDPFAGIDPQMLAKEALRVSTLTYYMNGKLGSSMIDPSDSTALAAAFEKDAPEAEMAVDAWMATLDPSAIPASWGAPRYDCTEKYGCPYSGRCINPGSWSSETTRCWVDNCGSGECTACPWFFPPMLKAAVIKGWCSYLCTADPAGNKIVALGGVGIKGDGTPFPTNKLVWCFNP